MMRDSEETIQRVLAGLRDAEAPHGMERRIVEALENRASGLAASNARGWKQLWLPIPTRSSATKTWAGRIALASILPVCFVIAVNNLRHVRMEPKLQSNIAGLSPEPIRAGVAHSAHSPSTEPSARIKPATPAPKARLSSVHESPALTEMRAVSHPAPIAPLTQEEKLLVRIVHRADPQELAMLNPQVRDQREAESEAEFLKFVDDSTKGDSE
jgi:hypothetical protein